MSCSVQSDPPLYPQENVWSDKSAIPRSRTSGLEKWGPCVRVHVELETSVRTRALAFSNLPVCFLRTGQPQAPDAPPAGEMPRSVLKPFVLISDGTGGPNPGLGSADLECFSCSLAPPDSDP